MEAAFAPTGKSTRRGYSGKFMRRRIAAVRNWLPFPRRERATQALLKFFAIVATACTSHWCCDARPQPICLFLAWLWGGRNCGTKSAFKTCHEGRHGQAICDKRCPLRVTRMVLPQLSDASAPPVASRGIGMRGLWDTNWQEIARGRGVGRH